MALPAGEVTFLFTDIEGSSALFASLGEAWPPVLARHDELLAAAVQDAGGQVVKTIGDAVFAAFETVDAALRAAGDGQRRIADEPWPEGVALRVRMGIHTGPAEPTAGDYVAFPVHQAARVQSAAHGGQVLVSGTSAAAARDPSALRRLGAFRLRDFPEPEDLHQLGPGTFPPPRTLSEAGHNLPGLRTTFVGRERERAELREAFAGASTVTLVGMGGVGKTRLALEHAADEVQRHPGGVWFLRLRELDGDDDLARRVLQVAGAPVGDDPTASLVAWAQRPALLVLDEAERHPAPVARLVGVLAAARCPVSVLVTSRAPLGLPGERVVALRPLGLPASGGALHEVADSAAGRLFLERAAAAGASVGGAAAGPAVAELCRRLDGIPLALELAAARSRSMAPADLLARLEERFRTLGRDPSRPEDQQTLDDTIDWSVQLLGAPARVLLRRLAVFAGSFDLGTAEEVCAGEPLALEDVAEAMEDLVDHSLVTLEGRRLRLLETVRTHAARALAASGEVDEAGRRHLRWALATARTGVDALERRDSSGWLERLDAEHENLLAAFRWSAGLPDAADDRLELAAALASFWRRSGRVADAVLQLESALLKSDGTPAVRSAALRGLAVLLLRAGHAGEARRRASEAVDAARDAGPEELAWSLAIEAHVLGRTGEHAAAEEVAAAAAAALPAAARPACRVEVLLARGLARFYAGDPDASRADFEGALEVARDHGLRTYTAQALVALAEFAYVGGDPVACGHLAAESLRISDERSDPVTTSAALNVLGWLGLRRGDVEKATARLCEALRVAQEGGQQMHAIWAVESLARAALDVGRAEDAVRLGVAAETMRRRSGVRADEDDVVAARSLREAAAEALGPERAAAIEASSALLTVDDAIGIARSLLQ